MPRTIRIIFLTFLGRTAGQWLSQLPLYPNRDLNACSLLVTLIPTLSLQLAQRSGLRAPLAAARPSGRFGGMRREGRPSGQRRTGRRGGAALKNGSPRHRMAASSPNFRMLCLSSVAAMRGNRGCKIANCSCCSGRDRQGYRAAASLICSSTTFVLTPL